MTQYQPPRTVQQSDDPLTIITKALCDNPPNLKNLLGVTNIENLPEKVTLEQVTS